MTNIDRIKSALAEHNLSAMLITSPASRLFATGFSSSAGVLLVTEDFAKFFIDSRYFEAAQQSIKSAEVIAQGKDEKLVDMVASVINQRKLSSVGFEDAHLSYKLYSQWNEKLEADLVAAQKLLSMLRAVKSRDELGHMIKAQRLAEKVFTEILPVISTNITENDLAAEMIYRSLKYGAEDMSFSPIVVSGTKSSMPHGVPGNEKIGKGFLTIDFGVKLGGWCSDTTRTLCIGKPDDEMINVYDTVLKAQKCGISAFRGGVSGRDVDAAARGVIESAGFGDYFGHGFGHAIGLEVHESLSASPLSEDTIPSGAVMSAEPGIYLPGKFGVRIEDVVFVTDDGCENITNLPKELTVLEI